MDPERALISKVAQTGKGLDDLLADGVTIEHFDSEENAEVWEFLVSHTERYAKQPGTNLIIERFPEFNFEISDQPLDYLRDRFVQEIETRESMIFAEDLMKACYEPKLQGRLAELILEKGRELTSILPGQRVARLSEAEFRIKEYERRVKEGTTHGLRMGLPAIDDATLGIQNHELVSVVGWQGLGKSTLAQYILWQFYQQERVSMFISLEMTAEALFRKWEQMINQFTSYKHLKMLNLTEDELAKWKDWAKQAKKNAKKQDILVLEDVRGCTVEKVHGEVMRHRPDVVAIDYITLMDTSVGSTTQRWEKMTKLSRQLKEVAMQTHTPIFSVAQTNRESAKDGAKLDNIGASYAIGADSDIVLGLHQDSEMKINKMMEVRLEKNRDGETLTEKMYWDMNKMMFHEFRGAQVMKTRKAHKLGMAGREEEVA